MALVKDYGLITEDDINFDVSFYIPDNCEYKMTSLDNKYTITVCLQKDESKPSTTFVKCEETTTMSSGELSVNFEQVLDGMTHIKPKMKVECGLS